MDDLNRRLARDLDGAFPEVVSLLGGRLYSGLRRLTGSHQEAEDLAQETLIRAYRALQGYERERVEALRLEAWVWTIALNLGRNHLRDRARRPVPIFDGDREVTDPEPVDQVAWDGRLARLSPAQRTAVVLRHVAGLSIDEICDVTGRPTGTVKADIHRALDRLRQIMEEEQ